MHLLIQKKLKNKINNILIKILAHLDNMDLMIMEIAIKIFILVINFKIANH